MADRIPDTAARRRVALAAAASFAGGLAVAYALRLLAIEPTWIGHLCQSAGAPAWCTPRAALLQVFYEWSVLTGPAILAAGLAAAIWPRAALVSGALAVAALGLVLYNTDLAVFAALLGLAGLARLLGRPSIPDRS